jgi:hypothetical protein
MTPISSDVDDDRLDAIVVLKYLRWMATPEADAIFAKSGNDLILDVGDGDVVYASSGNDSVFLRCCVVVSDVRLDLNTGHDTVRGRGADDSFVNGGSGNDVLDFNG